MTNINTNLKQKILDEMKVSYANALEKNFDLAKRFIRVTSEGRVEIMVKDQITGKEQILLYLVGKLYAREASLITVEYVGNKEFSEELGIPTGSLLPWLKDLRDRKKIRSVKKGYHQIPVNLVEKTLKEVEKKIK